MGAQREPPARRRAPRRVLGPWGDGGTGFGGRVAARGMRDGGGGERGHCRDRKAEGGRGGPGPGGSPGGAGKGQGGSTSPFALGAQGQCRSVRRSRVHAHACVCMCVCVYACVCACTHGCVCSREAGGGRSSLPTRSRSLPWGAPTPSPCSPLRHPQQGSPRGSGSLAKPRSAASRRSLGRFLSTRLMEETWAGRNGAVPRAGGAGHRKGGSKGRWAKPLPAVGSPPSAHCRSRRCAQAAPRWGGIEADAPKLVSEVLSCSRA